MKHEATQKLLLERLFVTLFAVIVWTAFVSWLFSFEVTGIIATAAISLALVSIAAKGNLPGDPNWS